MNASAQTFWLENLKSASQYNQWIFSQIRPYLGSDVLEVGCGNGNFSVLIAPHCQKLVALDLDESYVQQTQTRLRDYSHVEVLAADATEFQCDRTFDTIVMLDVLEHIEDDVGTLRALGRLLKPGGQLLVKVPALEALYSPMDRAIGHYRRYRQTTLADTFTAAGFQKPHVWRFNLAGIPGWWLNGCVLNRTTPPSSQVGLFDKVVPILQRLEALVPPPLGLSLYGVAALGSLTPGADLP
ncbi:MAG: class I SAM-dependent methyltransferase [Synechococcales bacterium]|nr:class I SAM-dependent methyltransferase [Synechococcales bacterium]